MSTNLNSRMINGRISNSEKLGLWFRNSEKLNAYLLNTALMSQANAALNLKLLNQLNSLIKSTALGKKPPIIDK